MKVQQYRLNPVIEVLTGIPNLDEIVAFGYFGYVPEGVSIVRKMDGTVTTMKNDLILALYSEVEE